MVALGYCWILNRDESNESRGFAYGAYPHQDNSQALIVADVAVVANVANVIDIKASRAKIPLLDIDSRSITVCKKCAHDREDAYFNIPASTKYNTSNTCIDYIKRDQVNTPAHVASAQ